MAAEVETVQAPVAVEIEKIPEKPMNGEVVKEAAPTDEAPASTVEANGDAPTEVPNGDAAHVESDVVENGDAAVAAEGDEVAVEKKEEESPPKVVLHMHPPVKALPTTSMFCMKLETYLRVNKIPYESHYGYKVGKNGKVPWVEYKGERVCDSNAIMEFVNNKFEIESIDDKLTSEQKFIGRAVQVMLEENTYWGLQYNRWIDSFADFKKMTQPEGGSHIGFTVNSKLSQRKVRSGLDQHGLGRQTKEDIYAITSKDLKALSGILGEKPFILGEDLSTVDLCAFALVAQITQSGLESPLNTLVTEECANLLEHFNRIKGEYWSDWDEVILGDRPVAPIKKGFSFRRKKNKKAKEPESPTKEGEETNGVTSEDATPEATPAEAEGEVATTEETAAEDATPAAAEATETAAAEPAAEETTETPAAETPAAETPAAEEPVANGDATTEEKTSSEAPKE